MGVACQKVEDLLNFLYASIVKVEITDKSLLKAMYQIKAKNLEIKHKIQIKKEKNSDIFKQVYVVSQS
jgi:hypothetical protein